MAFLLGKVDLTTKEGIEKLGKIKNYNTQKKLIAKNPDVILYASKYWSVDKDKFEKLVYEALVRKPELILSFNDKNGLNVNSNYVRMAVMSDPMIIAKLDKLVQDKYITKEVFVDAFAKNPLVLTIKDLKALKERVSNVVVEAKVNEKTGVTENITKEVTTTLRTELLKAIRLYEGVSKYHEGYDDYALSVVEQMKKIKKQPSQKIDGELLENFATLMNVMIKKDNQQLRVCTAKQWLVNNGKPMYKAVRKAAKQNSKLEGLLGDMPTDSLDDKLIKRLIIAAVKSNPDEYVKLADYGLERFIDDATIKYNVYKAIKKYGLMDIVEGYLYPEDIEKAKNKLAGVKKRKQTREAKKKQQEIEEEQQLNN